MSDANLQLSVYAEMFNRMDTFTGRQMCVLVTAHTHPGLSVKDIAEMAKMSKPAVTRACDKLEGLKLLRRAFNIQDRRQVRINVTALGVNEVRRILGYVPPKVMG